MSWRLLLPVCKWSFRFAVISVSSSMLFIDGNTSARIIFFYFAAVVGIDLCSCLFLSMAVVLFRCWYGNVSVRL